MSTNGNAFPSKAAIKMAQATEVCRWHEGSRLTLYFAADGRRLSPGGRNFGKHIRRNVDLQLSMQADFIVEYPFAPSVASYQDMVSEHRETGECVIYDSERWESDERVDEQISAYGPDVAEDWRLERLIEALEDDERKVAA
jgi:hypothetical protein